MTTNPYQSPTESGATANGKLNLLAKVSLSRKASYRLFGLGWIVFVLTAFALIAFRVESEQAYWILFAGPVLSASAILLCRCKWLLKILLCFPAMAMYYAGFILVAMALYAIGRTPFGI